MSVDTKPCAHDHLKTNPAAPLCDPCRVQIDCACEPKCTTCLAIDAALNIPDPHFQRQLLEDVMESNVLEALAISDALGEGGVGVLQVVLRYLEVPAFDPDGTAAGYPQEIERISELKAMRYEEYLRTPEWAEHRRRARLLSDGHCMGCDTDKHLETHHRTYERCGEEQLGDLVTLCAACHTAVHLVADANRGKVRTQSRRARR